MGKSRGKLRNNNEIIDKKLYGRNIKRIDNYIHSKAKIRFQCLINDCGNIWLATTNKIIDKKTGCPRCAGKEKQSNAIIDMKLQNKNIARLGNHINSKTPIHFKCLTKSCQYIWLTTTNHILNSNSGCPKCFGNLKLSNDILDKRLYATDIIRIGNYTNSRTKIQFKHNIIICNHIWMARPDDIFDGHSCPKCFGKEKYTNEMVDQKLVIKNIQRLDNYISNKISIKFKCLIDECDHIWNAMPFSILVKDTGCPKCSLKNNEKLMVELLQIHNIQCKIQECIANIDSNELRKMRVDVYIPNINIVIEYNGAQHYQPVRFGGIDLVRAEENLKKQKSRDRYLKKFCANNNIKLICIDGRKYTDLKLTKYMLEKIIPMITKQ